MRTEIDLNLIAVILVVKMDRCSVSPVGCRRNAILTKKRVEVLKLSKPVSGPFLSLLLPDSIPRTIRVLTNEFLSHGGRVEHFN